MELASDTLSSAACAAGTLASAPTHAFRHDVCSALPYENESVHGFFFISDPPLFMRSRCAVASSSLCPPERKRIPGTAAGHVRRSAVTVASATSPCVAFGPLLPPVTMLGLRIMPSSITLCFMSAANTALSTRSVTSAHFSMPCAPSVKISGSTMGTRPFCWQMAAYRAKHSALSSRHWIDGKVSPMVSTARHLAKRAPRA